MAQLSIGGTIDLEVGGNKISLLSTLAIHFHYPLPCTAIRLLSAAAIAITTDLHNASGVGRGNYSIEILTRQRETLTTLKSLSVRPSVVHLQSVSKC